MAKNRLIERRWSLQNPEVVFAVERQALPLMTQIGPQLAATGIAVCPTVFLAGQARVAAGG